MYLFWLLHFYCREGGCFLKKLLVYIRDFRLECVLAPLFKLLEASFELIVPLIMAAIIDQGIPSGDTGFIVRMCLWLVVLGGVGLLSSVTAQYFSAKAAIGFSAKLRHVLMAHIQTLSYTELDTVGTSTLITRMTSDINQVQTGVNMCLRLLLRSPFVVFGAMVMAFTIDTKCALIFAGVIAVLCVIVFSIMLATIPMYRRVQGQLDSVTATTRENLTGVRVVRAFCKEDAERAKFERKLQLLTHMQLTVGRISAMMNPATYVVINAAVIVLIHTGAVRVQMGALSQGQVVALYNYMSQILVELIKMANLIITLTKAAACGDRVAAVLAIRSTQKDGEKTLTIDAPRGSVVFDGVSMSYSGAGAESVSGVSFTAASGATIGVIGGTGSGKSTLVNLIPRFYDVTGGSVTVRGVTEPNATVYIDGKGMNTNVKAGKNGGFSVRVFMSEAGTETFTLRAKADGFAQSTRSITLTREWTQRELIAQFRQKMIALDYDELAKKPAQYAQKRFILRGKVMEFTDYDGQPCALVCVSNPATGVWEDALYVVLSTADEVEQGGVYTFYLIGEAITLPADGAYTRSGTEQEVPVATAVYVTKNK